MTLCLLILLSFDLRSFDLVLTNSAALYKVDMFVVYEYVEKQLIKEKN